MTLPTFLGIGVLRGGTTWLHELLVSHPDVYVPARCKETYFFDLYYERGLEWYEGLFPPRSGGGSRSSALVDILSSQDLVLKLRSSARQDATFDWLQVNLVLLPFDDGQKMARAIVENEVTE